MSVVERPSISQPSTPIKLDKQALETGYRNSRQIVKTHFAGQLWMFSNLPGEERRSLDTLLLFLIRTLDLLNLDSSNGLSLDVWHEVRDDLDDAFNGNCVSEEYAALIDTANRYKIPKQFLFDPLAAADTWIRKRQFDTFEELSAFAGKIGGSLLCASIPILGSTQSNFEKSAFQCGKAVFLTQVVAKFIDDLKLNRVFVAQQDIEDCDLDLHRLKLRQSEKGLTYLVRLYCSRIAKLYSEGGELLRFLDYDAKRSLTSLLAWNWRLLVKMQSEPESLLDIEGVLNKKELFELKARHVLGMEGNIPFAPKDDHH